MAAVPLLLLFVLAVAAAGGLPPGRRAPPRRGANGRAGPRPPPARGGPAAPPRLHATRTAVAAYAIGSAAALVVLVSRLGDTGPGGLGITVLLTPITYGVVHVAVLAAGELTWPRPQGRRRRARLVRRGPLDAAPGWLARTTAVVAALAASTLLWGTVSAGENG